MKRTPNERQRRREIKAGARRIREAKYREFDRVSNARYGKDGWVRRGFRYIGDELGSFASWAIPLPDPGNKRSEWMRKAGSWITDKMLPMYEPMKNFNPKLRSNASHPSSIVRRYRYGSNKPKLVGSNRPKLVGSNRPKLIGSNKPKLIGSNPGHRLGSNPSNPSKKPVKVRFRLGLHRHPGRMRFSRSRARKSFY